MESCICKGISDLDESTQYLILLAFDNTLCSDKPLGCLGDHGNKRMWWRTALHGFRLSRLNEYMIPASNENKNEPL